MNDEFQVNGSQAATFYLGATLVNPNEHRSREGRTARRGNATPGQFRRRSTRVADLPYPGLGASEHKTGRELEPNPNQPLPDNFTQASSR